MMEELQPVEPTLGTYLALAVRIGWGLIVLFGIVGTVVGHAAGPYVVLISAAIWATMRILYEALWCLRIWRLISHKDDPPDGPEE